MVSKGNHPQMALLQVLREAWGPLIRSVTFLVILANMGIIARLSAMYNVVPLNPILRKW